MREANGVARDGNLLLSSSASANPPASLQRLGKVRKKMPRLVRACRREGSAERGK
jgi:hypothetical protein